MPRDGINGLALSLAAGGALVAYSALKNQSVADALRGLATGATPKQAPTQPASVGSPTSILGFVGSVAAGITTGGLGAQVAADAGRYLGVPYKWAAHDPAVGFDCSGLVTWVLHHDFGIALPNNTHTVTSQFYVWSGATTIPRSACSPGDLVCYPSHIGIAVNGTTMINAPTAGTVVKLSSIYGGALIRRPKAYGVAGG